MALNAIYLADKSALARFPVPAVAARLRPLLEDGELASCAIVDLEVLYSSRNLAHYELTWTPEACVGVVLTSAGYPGSFEAGKAITGLDAASAVADVQVFHSGTVARDDRVVTAGGRVLTVTALGATLREARDRAYEACALIDFEGKTYRTDVAASAAQGAM